MTWRRQSNRGTEVFESDRFPWCHSGSSAIHVGAFNVTCYHSTIGGLSCLHLRPSLYSFTGHHGPLVGTWTWESATPSSGEAKGCTTRRTLSCFTQISTTLERCGLVKSCRNLERAMGP